MIHVGVTRSPTDAWTAQQLREATVYGVGPKYLIRDNDGKFGVAFDRVAKTSCIKILTTPYHAPRANAICERFLLSVRRECLDHLLILHQKHLHEPIAGSAPAHHASGKVISFPVPGGLYHDYRKSARVGSMMKG